MVVSVQDSMYIFSCGLVVVIFAHYKTQSEGKVLLAIIIFMTLLTLYLLLLSDDARNTPE